MSIHRSALWYVETVENFGKDQRHRKHFVSLDVNATKATPEVLDALGFVCFTATRSREQEDEISERLRDAYDPRDFFDHLAEEGRARIAKQPRPNFTVTKAEFCGECLS